ncbi:Hypothetical protein POVR2_LOCUS16 [uncultured virus]|nr:Hypothetical protein POVR2_LOCUS16 [uncultured virus]
MQKLGKLASTHLHTLKIARETNGTGILDYICRDEIVDVGVVEYLLSMKCITSVDRAAECALGSLRLGRYEVVEQIIDLLSVAHNKQAMLWGLLARAIKLQDVAAIQYLAKCRSILSAQDITYAIHNGLDVSLSCLVEIVDVQEDSRVHDLVRTAVYYSGVCPNADKCLDVLLTKYKSRSIKLLQDTEEVILKDRMLLSDKMLNVLVKHGMNRPAR